MSLFNKKYVYFLWDNDLVGKKVFVASSIDDLIVKVNGVIDYRVNIYKSENISFPFKYVNFVYYDPYYDLKRAMYIDNKRLQYKNGDTWIDITAADLVDIDFFEKHLCRIKPDSTRMTKRQLSEWLAKGFGEFRMGIESNNSFTSISYPLDQANEEVDDLIIRYWDSEDWITPTIDIYNKDIRVSKNKR